MAQTLSNLSNTIPLYQTFYNNKYAKCPLVRLRPNGTPGKGNVVKAMANNNNRRDSLNHLQRSSSNVKRREPSVPFGLWDRFPTARTLQQMMDTMDRIIEEPLAFNTQLPSSQLANEGSGYSRGRTPWEIKEGESEYKMRFDMPGMTREDVKVWVEDKMLVIKAEKVAKAKADGQENGGVEEEWEWSAKSFGKYSSRIALPEHVDYEKIKAEVKDGVLYIAVPKASTRSKVYDINVA